MKTDTLHIGLESLTDVSVTLVENIAKRNYELLLMTNFANNMALMQR